MRAFVGLSFLLIASAAAAQTAAPASTFPGYPAQPTIFADKHMAVATHPAAVEAALAVLREGGTAVDAAIAAQLVLGVVEPQSSGLGGGGFALHWSAVSSRLTAWDGRETAPLAAGPDLFLHAAPPAPDPTAPPQPGVPAPFAPDARLPMRYDEALAGGRSIGAPGLPALLGALHERFGTKPLSTLAAPAIRLAEEGFAVSPRLARAILENAPRLAADPEARLVFFDAAGAPLAEGATLRNFGLATSLRAFAEDGAAAFAEGEIAEAIVAAAQRAPDGGLLALEDLGAYRVLERRPVCARIRARYEVCGMGAPSSGGVGVAQLTGLLGHFPIARLGADSPQVAHLFLEASKLVYADRARYLADPDFVSVPQAGLIDPAYVLLRAQAIDPSSASSGLARAGNPPWRETRLGGDDPTTRTTGTAHLTIVDGFGDVVVLTSSVEGPFGAARMAAGVILNNELTDFAFEPVEAGLEVANAPGPRKRPRSTMAPTIVFDVAVADGVEKRRPALALGSVGGGRILEHVAATIVGVLDLGLAPGAAVARPHLSQRNRAEAEVEARADADALAAALAAMGHRVTRAEMTSGLGVIAIGAGGALSAAADPRREGVALGE